MYKRPTSDIKMQVVTRAVNSRERVWAPLTVPGPEIREPHGEARRKQRGREGGEDRKRGK